MCVTMPNIIDLFAGPGGLAEGFGSLVTDRVRRFNIRLSVEKESVPFQTLKLRAFFRSFEAGHAPPEYYEFLAGRITLEALYNAYPEQSTECSSEVLQATLGEYPHDLLDARIAEAIDGDPNWILTGGPPCQAYSTAGMVGNRTKKGYCPTDDPRFFLYKEYLRVVATHAPAVFVMENVKGLLMAKAYGKSIANEVICGLSRPSDFMLREFGMATDSPQYRLFSLQGEELSLAGNPNIFLVHAEKYGLPQARHRVIIIGIREGVAPELFVPPQFEQTTTTVNDVIGDLHPLRSRISRDKDSLTLWRENLVSILESDWLVEARRLHGEDLEKIIRESIAQLENVDLSTGSEWMDFVSLPYWNPGWYNDPLMQGTRHHEARPHILPDMHRYLFCSCFGRVFGRSPKMEDFPDQLLPKHDNAKSGHFKDRFRVQLSGNPANTVISHLNKDGHAFIHPDTAQCRSFTPREAARIQTFPDNYYFFGGRSHQFRQIGNAVPPWLARIIARSVSPLLPE